MLCDYNQSYLTCIKWGINKMSQELELIEMCILNKRQTFMTFSNKQNENSNIKFRTLIHFGILFFSSLVAWNHVHKRMWYT